MFMPKPRRPCSTRRCSSTAAATTPAIPRVIRKTRPKTPSPITTRFATRFVESRQHKPGSEKWFEAVIDARKENGEHLDEEEREAMPDFIKSASLELRHELAMQWLRFYADA